MRTTRLAAKPSSGGSKFMPRVSRPLDTDVAVIDSPEVETPIVESVPDPQLVAIASELQNLEDKLGTVLCSKAADPTCKAPLTILWMTWQAVSQHFTPEEIALFKKLGMTPEGVQREFSRS